MKDKFILKMEGIAEKYKLIRKPVLMAAAVYLAFYRFFSMIFENRRRIVSVVSILFPFAVVTSFAYPGSDAVSVLSGRVYMETVDGIVEIDELDDIDVEAVSATEEDIRALLDEKKDEEDIISKDPGTIEEGTRIYDEVNGYEEATFEDDWKLILINKENPVPDDYEFELGTIRGGIRSDVRVIEHVLEMIQAAKEDGVTLGICSPYRDYDRQVMLFERKVRSYIRKGKSEAEAYELASQTVAIPGTSEHQVGLAFDFISDDYKVLEAGFADHKAGKWLKANGYKYGFILRYPDDKENITGIEFEPWHYRYVGVDAATEIMTQGLCLEEYVEQIGLK